MVFGKEIWRKRCPSTSAATEEQQPRLCRPRGHRPQQGPQGDQEREQVKALLAWAPHQAHHISAGKDLRGMWFHSSQEVPQQEELSRVRAVTRIGKWLLRSGPPVHSVHKKTITEKKEKKKKKWYNHIYKFILTKIVWFHLKKGLYCQRSLHNHRSLYSTYE